MKLLGTLLRIMVKLKEVPQFSGPVLVTIKCLEVDEVATFCGPSLL